MKNSENDQSFLKPDVQTNNDNHVNSENRVTFQSSFIVPPRSNLNRSIKMPIIQTNDYRKSYSQRAINSARISNPISYDIPLIPIIDHNNEMNNLSGAKNKKSSYTRSRRPLSARNYNNVTLDSLLNSVEKEISYSKRIQKTKISNLKVERTVSSRRSANVNHFSMYNSKIKVQRPLSPRYHRNETEKPTLSFGYYLNRKYP